MHFYFGGGEISFVKRKGVFLSGFCPPSIRAVWRGEIKNNIENSGYFFLQSYSIIIYTQKTYSFIKGLVKRIRDGLFLASSRSYGEQYIEPFVRKKYNLKDPTSNDHDATDKDGKRYEIKACKVLRATDNSKKSKTIIERILFENKNIETNRLILFSECKTDTYLANVQNVKRDHFDYLMYVLLFEDCVKIFSAKKEEIETQIFSSWSDKHGRYDELGKSGQFGITKNNIQWHLDNHLKDTVTYDEMKNIYNELSK